MARPLALVAGREFLYLKWVQMPSLTERSGSIFTSLNFFVKAVFHEVNSLF